MAERSARFGLPLLAPGQAQKELFHNEALALLDAAIHPAVEGAERDDPPDAPAEGAAWLVGEAPAGEWANHAGRIACYTDGGWRFVTPVDGMMVWRRDAGRWLFRVGKAWQDAMPVGGISVWGQQVVGPRQPAIASPYEGTTIDAEARAALDAIIAALKSHGLVD